MFLCSCLRIDQYSFPTSNPEKKFKVNSHHFKPYLTSEPSTLENKVNVHIPEVHKEVTRGYKLLFAFLNSF